MDIESMCYTEATLCNMNLKRMMLYRLLRDYYSSIKYCDIITKNDKT